MVQVPLPRLSTEIYHDHDSSHHPRPPTEKNPATDLAIEKPSLRSLSITGRTTYKYLEWSTEPGELYPFPERLPLSVTKQTNPFTWSSKQKSMILALACYSTAMAAYAGGAYTSGIGQMSLEWGVSRVALLVGITMFTTGFAVAPLFLAPLSEVSQLRDFGGRTTRPITYSPVIRLKI